MVLVLGLLIIGTFARLIPHVSNFSPVIAIALFGGAYLRRSQALWLPLLLMVVTDVFLGLHGMIAFTWGGVLLTSFIGLWVRKDPGPTRMVSGAVAAAVMFFVVTNFGAWLAFYPMTIEGFISCYTMAVPFFRMSILSTLLYSVVLFQVYEIFVKRIKISRLAPVLLNQ